MDFKIYIMEDYLVAFFNELGNYASFWGTIRLLSFSALAFFSGMLLKLFLSELVEKYRSFTALSFMLCFFAIFLAIAVRCGFYLLNNPIYEVRVVSYIYLGIFIVLGIIQGYSIKENS